MGEQVITVDAPHFNAGVVALNGRIIDAAPILRYMIGWDGRRFADYCRSKGWRWEKCPTFVPPS